MPTSRRWTREETLLALDLYLRTPFGRQHSRYPPIVALAENLGRSAGSVAMKLNNLTSLDPKERERGVKGLQGASQLDRQIWEEFAASPGRVAEEIESVRMKRIKATSEDLRAPTGPSDGVASTVARRHQRFFRRVVLGSYDSRCCVTGNPVPQLLRASHILPWRKASEAERIDPCNGLCLAATFDAAFDGGLISFDPEYRLLVSPALRAFLPDPVVQEDFVRREGQPMRLPEKNLPDRQFVDYHRESIFLKAAG